MLALDNITKSFGARLILDHVSWSMNDDGRVGLVGLNGAGKSTLLRLIAEVFTPDSGRIARPQKTRVGYLAQDAPEMGGRSLLAETLSALDRAQALDFRRREVEEILAREHSGPGHDAALEELGERISSAINEAMAIAGPDVLSHMQAAVKALVRFLADHPREARILIVESSGLGKRLEAVRRRIIASHTRGVEQALGAIAHRLPPMETTVVARCWMGAVYEAVFCWLEQPAAERAPAGRLATAIAHFNLRGIGAPPEVFEETNDDGSLV